MSYLLIKDFARGLDRRRMIETTVAQSMIQCTNAHITRGGEVEKRKRFGLRYTLPPGTHNLYVLDDVIYVFGSGPDPGVPAGVTYVRLDPAGGGTMTRVLDADWFSGKLYVIAEYESPASVTHFYDGVEVTDSNVGGTQALAQNNKLYAVDGSLLRFSAIGDPTDWGDGAGTGDGFIDMINQAKGTRSLQTLIEYQSTVALLSRRDILVWALASDPAQDVKLQTLSNTGTVWPRSATQFGDSDVFYLDYSGIRSLKARDSSNAAYVSDIGTPIDTLVQESVLSVGDPHPPDPYDIQGIMEPSDGRFWMAIEGEIFVYTFFPSSDIKAWSRYTFPYHVKAMSVDNDRTYIRVRDSENVDYIYEYGYQSDAEGTVWDDVEEVTIQLPFLDAEKPATLKDVFAFDCACEGVWNVSVAVNPEQPDTAMDIATVYRSTYGDYSNQFGIAGNHVSMIFKNTEDGYARIGNASIHMRMGEAA